MGCCMMTQDENIKGRMYAILCGAMDDALTLLENGLAQEARRVLLAGLERAENLYLLEAEVPAQANARS